MTITVDSSLPEIGDVIPNRDLSIMTGDEVEISFRSNIEDGIAKYDFNCLP